MTTITLPSMVDVAAVVDLLELVEVKVLVLGALPAKLKAVALF